MILITRDGDRLIGALETIAQQLNARHQIADLKERIEHLESHLKYFLRLAAKPEVHATEWDSLVARIQETIS